MKTTWFNFSLLECNKFNNAMGAFRLLDKSAAFVSAQMCTEIFCNNEITHHLSFIYLYLN